MFEASLEDSSILKKIVDAIKELVKEVNFQIDTTGISLQAMDTSHVALISASIKAAGLSTFNCVKPITLGSLTLSPLGINMENLLKVMKLSGENDSVKLRADETADKLILNFDDKSMNVTRS